uniref:Solute carrier family 41 member 1-like n=1 Tax=Dermatophagoides pteronyssinus TaxID=6956 RepID=A0A6P6YB30_DERPT
MIENIEHQHGGGGYQAQNSWTIFRQMIIPFFLSGLGCGLAGIVLNHVAEWPVFIDIPQISIMVPAFIGMIGNIETTLASRLSTNANLGRMDTWKDIGQVVGGNFLVIECQSILMSLFAAFMSLLISTIRETTRDKITLETTFILCAGSVISSILANTLIASIVTILVIIGRRININPDNISAPVAACMGDASTVAILANINSLLYSQNPKNQLYISVTILAITVLIMAPVFIYLARHNNSTRSVIYSGWIPLLAAILLCKPAGLIMELSMEQWPVISTFFPLVDGVGAQAAGLQTSRISTFLHSTSQMTKTKQDSSSTELQQQQERQTTKKWFFSPLHVFFSKELHSKLVRMLTFITPISHLIFLSIIFGVQHLLNEPSFHFTIAFILTHLIAVFLQIIILLYLSYLAVFWTWNHGINPDNSVMPLATTLSDSLGICFITIGFHLLNLFNDI